MNNENIGLSGLYELDFSQVGKDTSEYERNKMFELIDRLLLTLKKNTKGEVKNESGQETVH